MVLGFARASWRYSKFSSARWQILRARRSSGTVIRLKEVKEPTGKTNELNRRLFLYYTMKDKDWASWLSRIF